MAPKRAYRLQVRAVPFLSTLHPTLLCDHLIMSLFSVSIHPGGTHAPPLLAISLSIT